MRRFSRVIMHATLTLLVVSTVAGCLSGRGYNAVSTAPPVMATVMPMPTSVPTLAPTPTASMPSMTPDTTLSASAQPTATTLEASSMSSSRAKSVEAFVPTTLVAAGKTVPVLSMPLATDETFPVPPFGVDAVNPKWSAAWWNGSAKPGSGQGVVHLDVHTYSLGGAMGNLLGKNAQVGDIIELQGADGESVRYRVSEIKTWKAADVPMDEMLRRSGPETLIVEFCWESLDHWGDGQWRLRRYDIAKRIS